MAERRMFAKTIIDSDAFLDMPMSARLLYYDLSMRADDDGFNNSPKKVMRTIGATIDDMNILIARKFIIPFENGVVVIKHWRIHNYIRKDTYNETPYKEQKALLELDENRAYRIKKDDCLLPVDDPLTQDRLGKDSIGKDRLDNSIVDCDSQKDAKFEEWWEHYPRKIGKAAARKAFSKVRVDVQVLIDAVEAQKHSTQWTRDNGQYIPNPTTWLNQGRWEDEVVDTKTAKRTDIKASKEDMERMRKILERM